MSLSCIYEMQLIFNRIFFYRNAFEPIAIKSNKSLNGRLFFQSGYMLAYNIISALYIKVHVFYSSVKITIILYFDLQHMHLKQVSQH